MKTHELLNLNWVAHLGECLSGVVFAMLRISAGLTSKIVDEVRTI